MSNTLLYTTNDTYIDSGNTGSNFATSNTATIGWDGTHTFRMLVRFDLTTLAPTTSYGYLTIYQSAASSASPVAASIYLMSDSIKITDGATWNTYDGTNNWPGGAGGAGDVNAVSPATFTIQGSGSVPGQTSVNIQTLIQTAITAGQTQAWLLIKRTTDTSGAARTGTFSTLEDATQGNRPQLTATAGVAGSGTLTGFGSYTYIDGRPGHTADTHSNPNPLNVGSVSGTGDQEKAVVYWNLGGLSIPAGAFITGITLTLVVDSVITGSDYSGGKVTRNKHTDWVAAQASWTNYKTGSAWSGAGATSSNDTDTTMIETFNLRSAAGNLVITGSSSSGLFQIINDAIANRSNLAHMVILAGPGTPGAFNFVNSTTTNLAVNWTTNPVQAPFTTHTMSGGMMGDMPGNCWG